VRLEDDRRGQRRLHAVNAAGAHDPAEAAERRPAGRRLGVVGQFVEEALDGRRRAQPADQAPLPGGESRVFVKRCLAGPGDIVPPGLGQAAGTVMPPDRYFMVGDNRAESRDSRSFGPVPRSAIVGRAVLVYWSVDPARGGAQGIRWSRIGTVVE